MSRTSTNVAREKKKTKREKNPIPFILKDTKDVTMSFTKVAHFFLLLILSEIHSLQLSSKEFAHFHRYLYPFSFTYLHKHLMSNRLFFRCCFSCSFSNWFQTVTHVITVLLYSKMLQLLIKFVEFDCE